jgi:Restriction endonuclease S subunits
MQDSQLLPEFLCRVLKSKNIREELIDGGGGTNISNLNQKMLSELEIPIVDYEEQVSLLERFDKLEARVRQFSEATNKKLELVNALKVVTIAQEVQSEAA